MAKKLSRGVAVVGVGMSKFGVFPEKTSRDLFWKLFKSFGKAFRRVLTPKISKLSTWATLALIILRIKLTWRR